MLTDSLTLRTSTPPHWAQIALENFDAFLLDHAACERKASAVGMSFVAKYADRMKILDPMISFAREELLHFHQVYRLIEARGLGLKEDTKDEYVNLLMDELRTSREERFLDRLLVSSIIEARGFERLCLIQQELQDDSLKSFYGNLARAEGQHRSLFLKLAAEYFPRDEIDERLTELLIVESTAISSVPFRSALH